LEQDPDIPAPPYPVLAHLLRARLRHLPEPTKPPATHRHAPSREIFDRGDLPELPAGDAGAPPVLYRIKVTLKGSKPPIWRRLQLPADLTLAELHIAIQI